MMTITNFLIISFYSLCKVIISISAAWLAFVLFRRYLRRRNYRLPPGPVGLPILGHVTIFEYRKLFDHRDEYGDISYLNLLCNDVVVLNSLESIRHALTANDKADIYSHRPNQFSDKLFTMFTIILGAPTPEWKQLKRTVQPLLKQHGEGIAELEGIVCEELRNICDLIEKNLNTELDMEEYIKTFAVNVMSTLLISERYEHGDPFITKIRHQLDVSNKLTRPFLNALLDIFPFIRFLPFDIGRTVRKYVRATNEITDYFVYKQRQISNDELKTRKGIVFDLIRLQITESWLRDAQIEGTVHAMLGAGVVTTSSSLYAFFLIILKHPDVQMNIQKEIDRCIGNKRCPRVEDRLKMAYTQAVILELLRYTSIVPSVPRSCSEDDEICGYTIPTGSTVIVNLFRVHHDEGLWKNPWQFDPLRFIDYSGELIPPSHPIRRNLIPFGIGKRVCMGEVLAKTRVFLFIVYLLQRFSFLSATDVPPNCDPRDFISNFAIYPAPYTLKCKRRY